MPTLNRIGKEKVLNHHRDVPFKVLEHKYGFNKTDGEIKDAVNSGNKIIHGDNLEALKSLLPEYEGKIKCIYIDPPYNTGNENWVYNDNVNHPKIKKWLGQVVGSESDDLSRHDKWLCMMYPRLKLLHKLLSIEGAIFISIDDNEQANLKLICDEIFGISNFAASIPWRKRTAKSDVPFGISQDYESILCYSKKGKFYAAIEGRERKYYTTPDFPNRQWRVHDLTKQTTAKERPNSFFTIVNPKNGQEFPANPLRTWAITKETFPEYLADDRIVFPGDYNFLNVTKPVLRYWKDDDRKNTGGNFGFVAMSTNLPKNVGMTQDGTKEITAIFGEKKFSFPKPSTLIQYLINAIITSNNNAIVLDSFAGSGTSAHAVLNLNKLDGGNRKFILVEMEDYANTITAERVKRVIKGYGDKEGTGGSFDYYELGKPLFTGENNEFLNEEVDISKIREYIWYSETRKAFAQPEVKTETPYFLGKKEGTAYYFIYEKESLTTLDYDTLSIIKTRAGQYVIYADNCLLPKDFMMKKNIVFKKIPRDVTRF